jgi:hypothetical protein
VHQHQLRLEIGAVRVEVELHNGSVDGWCFTLFAQLCDSARDYLSAYVQRLIKPDPQPHRRMVTSILPTADDHCWRLELGLYIRCRLKQRFWSLCTQVCTHVLHTLTRIRTCTIIIDVIVDVIASISHYDMRTTNMGRHVGRY